MKLLVLGAGAIGGYFGGRLAQAGADVTFLVREKRREQLRAAGLVIESPLGSARLDVRTVTAAELAPGHDLVLLTCKAYDLDAAMDAIAPAMDGKCAVVPLLNGVEHLERLDARFGRAAVMGGTCQINVSLGRDGVVHHLDALARVLFGERDRSVTPRAQALADALDRTGVEWKVSDDIEQDLWEKIVFLSALAATNCLFRANVGEIVAAPGGTEAILSALEANIAIATRAGHAPRAPAIAFARERLTTPGGKQSASMLRDLEAGGRVESEQIVGFMLRKAREHGVDNPVLALAYTHLKAYEARRDAARLPHA
jgi:2-dehydropantoate 2-reductase